MWRSLQNLFGLGMVALLIGGPVAFAFHYQNQMRNLHVVREGVLYRSGQMSLAGLKRMIHDYGIKTVVTLRDAYTPGEPAPDWDEESYCRAHDIDYYRIPPRKWEGLRGEPAPVEPGVRTFREIMAEPANHPVLVHCFAGIHRTGAYCAIYRMEFEHWSNAEAIAEMKRYGYTNLDDEWDILGYIEQYRPSWRAEEPLGKPRNIRKTRKKKKPAGVTCLATPSAFPAKSPWTRGPAFPDWRRPERPWRRVA